MRETSSFGGQKQFNNTIPTRRALFLADYNNHNLIDSHVKSLVINNNTFPEEVWMGGVDIRYPISKIKGYSTNSFWNAKVKIHILPVDNRQNVISQIKKTSYFDKIFMIRGLCYCMTNKFNFSCAGIRHPIRHPSDSYNKFEAIRFLENLISLLDLKNKDSMIFLGGPIDLTEYRYKAFESKMKAAILSWKFVAKVIAEKYSTSITVDFVYLNLEEHITDHKFNVGIPYIKDDGLRVSALVIRPKSNDFSYPRSNSFIDSMDIKRNLFS
ncbi:hypothetical protein IB642_02945 [Allofrancisella guangzhouensis]|uniref:Uncharacterized protein n=1 Tax=Allofrancisella guangzhouensis TaxID=594679 RepID=A0A0A8E5K9_9GAMM|nr:hypothetical protein [Allofrancisella guangzhouensis]AJC49500.1 hypothetical protein SD28_07695 [Allofrancisella guangzhouensis]MBK2027960.1 hypothetical protein [Allofrancisella guangzhouensis]MBK2043974.1 hypothetical protein [Allofrancisella guangzhouensis]MBK2045910.1 hypothetical protein [Allofrancisella guangzhouensis]